ncbi:MAG: transporter substrate-binding domain-containing protein, partial [Oscillospiraceae bacterium]|nr:transporter substrate-binding domain-containing protein [Oscillospiraceae bacterium]
MKKVLSAFAAVIMAAAVCAGCSSVKPNEVFSVADLTGKTIGVQLGTTGDIYAEDEVEDAKIERYKSGADAVQALKQGKVDAVIIDNEPAKVFVSKNSDLKILDEEFITEEYAIAIKKGNTELTDAINTALAELKADGTM